MGGDGYGNRDRDYDPAPEYDDSYTPAGFAPDGLGTHQDLSAEERNLIITGLGLLITDSQQAIKTHGKAALDYHADPDAVTKLRDRMKAAALPDYRHEVIGEFCDRLERWLRTGEERGVYDLQRVSDGGFGFRLGADLAPMVDVSLSVNLTGESPL